MFQLDDKFLKGLNLDDLPEGQKQSFLDHIRSQLEQRVGIRLSDGLTDAQLTEFELFLDRNNDKVRDWVALNAPAYNDDPDYLQLRDSAPAGVDEALILAEYASLKWLGINRPNYKEVVSQVLEELRSEIMNSRDAILAN